MLSSQIVFDARRILLSSFNVNAVQRWYPPLLASGATEASPPSVACELPVDKPVPSRGTGAAHIRCAENSDPNYVGLNAFRS